MTQKSSSLVGRATELAELESALDAVAGGSGRLFVLSGEPGIGKTRLADEVSERARGRGMMVHWGRCWEVGGAPAFWPWIQIFRSILRDARSEPIARAYSHVLSRLLPELRAEAASAELDHAQARFQLFDELWALLRAVAQKAPLVLVLDDLHAADPSSAALLHLVARDLRDSSVLVVVTARDREAKPEPAVADAIRKLGREGVSLALARLGVEEVGAILEERAGGAVASSVAAKLHATTDGNPLFVDQVCRLLAARNALRTPPDVLPVPNEMREAIRGRLAALEAEARSLLDAAAVLGRDFTMPLLASVAGLDEDVARRLAARAFDAGILQEQDLATYEFSHAVFGEAVYRDMPSGRRAELHARAAAALESSEAPERARSEVAQHLLAAVSVVGAPRAFEGTLRAARRALGALAFEDAATIVSAALDRLGPELRDEASRAEALVLLAEANARAGDFEAARKACDAAAAIARAKSDPELLSRAALALGAELMPGRILPSLITILEEARDALPRTSTPLRARVLARLAAALQPHADPEMPIGLAREAVAMARALGDPRVVSVVLLHAGSALVDFGDPVERIGWDGELLRLAEQDHDMLGVLRACVRLFFDRLELGETTEADEQLEAHAEEAERLGLPEHLWRTLMMRGLRALWDGRLEDAATLAEQARRIAQRGRIAEAAIAPLLQSWGHAFAKGERFTQVEACIATLAKYPVARELEPVLRAFDCYEAGDREGAKAFMARVPLTSEVYTPLSPAFRFLAPIAAFLDDKVIAERIYPLLKPYAGRLFSWGRIGMFVEGPVTWLMGIVSATLGELDRAEQELSHALAHCVEVRMRPYEAIIALDYARVLKRRGDAAKYDEVVRRGLAVTDELGIASMRRRFEAIEGEGARAPSVPKIASVAPAAPQARPGLELTRDGETWEVRAGDRSFRLKDTRGMRMLAQLVSAPQRELHVLTLMGAEGADAGDAGEVLDARAQQAYRARLEDLRDQLAEAESFGDRARAARVREEIERIADELAAGVGLGGRARRAGSAAERARVNVQRRLRDAVRRVGEQDPALGKHLERSLRTGTFCAYEPD
jgi:tetratricopeptide (TPR) repeat protein